MWGQRLSIGVANDMSTSGLVGAPRWRKTAKFVHECSQRVCPNKIVKNFRSVGSGTSVRHQSDGHHRATPNKRVLVRCLRALRPEIFLLTAPPHGGAPFMSILRLR